MAVFEKAPAKINLSLDVLYKRPDAYHEVAMIMTSIDLYDHIELTPIQSDRIEVTLYSRYVPNDERNLAYKAAKVFKERYRIRAGVHINIEKNIPVSAGLGGGSTDAAAVLRGLNEMWQVGASLHELAELGGVIGSDVPFCVYGHTAIATGRGEKIRHLPSPVPCWVILAKPDIGVSTGTVFRHVDLKYIRHPNTEKIMASLYHGDFMQLCENIGNALETTTMGLHPEVQYIKEKMVQAGAAGALMSGSGPTIYGLVQQQGKAQRIYNGMRGFCQEVFMVRTLV
ncbi:4-(cytidine 5'-diphospho)-2-C-methyl-D-erythritol kinase [Virgibacillus halophilus]|uniref:4-diphosphocytidyl-2-C-methyl-D-erythritol kinase n=1 Tax=Tigheibacillus halophilus TaxID=361280 RepID=A0ABU5C7K8_9BACI|nr:4-(cytidine 5'-diphospho)-2-C-methyl-D-erythritol kinase [Virgibacillus halophilus]